MDNPEKSEEYDRIVDKLFRPHKSRKKQTTTKRFLIEDNVKLFPHQIEASAKMYMRDKTVDTNNFILSHCMGAGKTLTSVLAYGLFSRKNPELRNCVIVAPKSTLIQWTNTFLKFTTINESKILTAPSSAELSIERLQAHKIIIMTQECLTLCYTSCHTLTYENVENTRTKKIRTVKYYKKTSDLHPIFTHFPDPFIIYDEIHQKRNEDTIASAACNLLSVQSRRILGLTGTLVCNGTQDLVGIGHAIGMTETQVARFENHGVLREPIAQKRRRLEQMIEFTHIVHESVLKLPRLINLAFDVALNMKPQHAVLYNDCLQDWMDLRKKKPEESTKVKMLGYISYMQQLIFCPLLYKKGSPEFKEKPELFTEAVQTENVTGYMESVHMHMKKLQDDGHERIILACTKVTFLIIMQCYLQTYAKDEFGAFFLYTGSTTTKQREDCKIDFLACQRGVLFLSTLAGGVGLDLVPGCSAMLIFGPMPYSFSDIMQLSRRIYRIGQTQDVKIVFLVPFHSIDYGICGLHYQKKWCFDVVTDQEDPENDERNAREMNMCIIDRLIPMPSPRENTHCNFPTFTPGDRGLMPDIDYSSYRCHNGTLYY